MPHALDAANDRTYDHLISLAAQMLKTHGFLLYYEIVVLQKP